MTEQKINEFFTRLRNADPEPVSELEYRDPYTLLIAVVLSAQATDRSVNKATPALFAAAGTPQAMVGLGEKRVGELIKMIGLHKTKARRIIGLSKALLDDYGGDVPQSRDELVRLPGVGRKTANVVLNVAFGQPTLGVDTHIHRVANRTGMVHTKTPEETGQALLEVVPEAYMAHAITGCFCTAAISAKLPDRTVQPASYAIYANSRTKRSDAKRWGVAVR